MHNTILNNFSMDMTWRFLYKPPPSLPQDVWTNILYFLQARELCRMSQVV